MHMVHAVVSAAEHAGAAREHVIDRSGITREQLDGHEAWLSVCDYQRVIDTALDATGDPLLGLRFGERTSSVTFQLLGHLVEHSETLGDALDLIVRYTELLAQDFKPLVISEGERVTLRFAWLRGGQAAVRVIADLAMVGLVRLLRQYVGASAHTASVSFAYPTPVERAEYRRVFGGRERFEQPFTQLQFPRAWLARTQLHSNPELHRVLKLQADRQLALQRSAKLSARVRQLLAAEDARALPSMSAVARALGVSTRTLTRRLKAEAVTFAELVAERRSAAARGLLESGALSVHEVADALGFADAPAFHKAFKRWTGLTPLQYRSGRRG